MLVRMGSSWNSYRLQVGMQSGTAMWQNGAQVLTYGPATPHLGVYPGKRAYVHRKT